MRKQIWVCCAILACVFFLSAGLSFSAPVIYVNGETGQDLWPGDTATSPVLLIQTAITKVDSGGTIILQNSKYIQSSTNITKSCTIQGESRSGVIIAPSAEDTGDGTSNTAGTPQYGIRISIGNVAIKNLTIDGSANNIANGGTLADHNNFRLGIWVPLVQSPNDITIDNVTVSHIRRRGINLTGSANTTAPRNYRVTNCLVEYVDYQYAMNIPSVTNCVVSKNTVENCPRGINVQDSTGTAPADAITTISQNTVTCGVTPGSIGDLAGWYNDIITYRHGNVDRTVFFTDNIVNDTSGTKELIGAKIYNANAQSIVSGNIFNYDSGSDNLGMYIGGCAGTVIENNTIRLKDRGRGIVLGRGSTTLPVTPNIVRNNIITTTNASRTAFPDSCGIYMSNDMAVKIHNFYAEAPYNVDNTISGNTISGFVEGIAVQRNPSITYISNATINNDNNINGCDIGILVKNGTATITANDSTINGNDVGIDIDGGTASITQNTITANGIGVRVQNSGTLSSFAQNYITNNTSDGIQLNGTIASTTIYNNEISGNAGYGINNLTGTTVNASGNYFGSFNPAEVAGEISGAVDYTPWIHFSADTSANPGYQGDFSYLHVDDSSAQTGAVARIKEAINMVSGSTVYLEAGTYTEDILINKSLTLTGAGSSSVILEPVGAQADLYYLAPTHLLITASDVVVENVQLSGNESICDEGIMIEDCDNVTIQNCDIHNYNSDAIYVMEGTGASNENINILSNAIHHIRENNNNIGWLTTVIVYENATGTIDNNDITTCTVAYAINTYLDVGYPNLPSIPTISNNRLSTILSPMTGGSPALNRAIICMNPANIINNTIRNSNYGIQIQLVSAAGGPYDGDILIDNNKVYDLRVFNASSPSTGIYLNSIDGQAARSVVVSNNIVDGVDSDISKCTGFFTWNTVIGNILWENNSVNGYGIGADFRQSAAPAIFRSNTLTLDPSDNSPVLDEYGLFFRGGSALAVERNIVRGFDACAQVNNDANTPDLGGGARGSVGFNDFHLYAVTAIKNDGAVEIKAENNYFGTISWFGYAAINGIKDRITGLVDYAPWSDSALAASYPFPATVQADDNNLGNTEEGAGSSGGIYGYNAFANIQESVNNVVDGTVLVAPGTYAEGVDINKIITLQSTAGAAVTTIDGTGTARSSSLNFPCAVNLAIPNVSGDAIIDGFTIKGTTTLQVGILVNGRADLAGLNGPQGANSTFEIRDCVFDSIPSDGMAINLHQINGAAGCSGLINNNEITNCGTGIRTNFATNCAIEYNLIQNNTTGIYMNESTNIQPQYNNILANTTHGITINGNSTGDFVRNNNIVGNVMSGVNNLTAMAADVDNNWWGSYAGPGAVDGGGRSGDVTLGTVNSAPFTKGEFLKDSDGDGINDNTDTDDDQDLFPDTNETVLASDELDPDEPAVGGYNTVWVDDDWTTATPGMHLGSGWYFGINAFATIQNGVNAVYDAGNVIVFAGTYPENVLIAKPVNLFSSENALISPVSGYAVRLRSPGGTPLENVLIDGFTITSTAATGLVFDGGAFSPEILNISDAIIRNCDFTASAWEGIGIINSANIFGLSVQNSTFSGNGNGIAISNSSADGLSVSDCSISGNSQQGIYCVSSTITNLNINNTDIASSVNPPLKLDGCDITTTTISRSSFNGAAYGIDIRGCSNTTNFNIFKSTISGHSGYGILVICGTLDKFKAEACLFEDNGCDIYLTGSDTFGNLNIFDMEIVGNIFGVLAPAGTDNITIANYVSFNADDIQIHVNQFLSGKTGINNTRTVNVDALNNYWGSASGPSGSGSGSGAAVSSAVIFSPWSYFGGRYMEDVDAIGGTVAISNIINDKYTKHSVILPGLSSDGLLSLIPPADRHSVNNSAEINLQTASLSGDTTITLEYDPAADIGIGYDEMQMRLAKWDGLAWQFLPSTLDMDNNTVSGQVSSLSQYGALPNVAVITPTPTPTPSPTPSPTLTPTPTPVTPIYEDQFTSQGEWVCWSAFSTTAPSSIGSWGSGSLQCKWPVYPLPSPGFFQWLKWNPEHTGTEKSIGFLANNIYILKTRLSADNNDTVPYLRVRTQADDNTWTATTVFGKDDGNPNQGGSPKTTSADFYMVWQPQGSTSDAFIAFDIYSGWAYTGIVYVEDVNVYRVPVPAATTVEATVSNFSGWNKIGSNVDINPTYITIGDTSTWSAAGQYITLSNAVTPGSLYRVKYTLLKIGSQKPDQFRLRVADSYNGAYVSSIVFNQDLSSAAQQYTHYHYALDPRWIGTGDLTVFLDTIEYVQNAATTVLNQISIEKVTLPPLE